MLRKIPLLLLLPLLLCLPLLDGCTTTALGAFSKVGQVMTPTSSLIVQAAVDSAVAHTVGNNPATQKANAIRIKLVAQQVLALDNATAVVPALEAVLNAKIAALHLNVGDQQAAMLLTATLETLLNAKIAATPGGAVTANTQVAIAGVANAVITACSLYGA